jgi:hypothetical protein
MIRYTALVSASALILSGCSPLPRQAETLVALKSCCNSVAEFKYQELRENETVQLLLDESAPVFGFPSGKSYFSAFHLVSRPGANIELRTHLFGQYERNAQVFCPSVAFLDSQFRAISTELLVLSYQSVNNAPSYWRSRAPVPVGTEYVIVHTEDRRVGNQLAISTPGSGPFIGFMGAIPVYYSRGGPGQQRYPCGQIGNISMTVTNEF